MTMKPLADRVLIKVEKEEEKTVGGLVLATKNPAGVPAKGKVVACGEGKFSPNGTQGWRYRSDQPQCRSDRQAGRRGTDTGI